MNTTEIHPSFVDFGPRPTGPRTTQRWLNRPHCDCCGPFRGRYLRKVGRDEFGTIWRCLPCDED